MVTQQRVELRFGSTDHKAGTVTKVYRDGRFRVSYDSYLCYSGGIERRVSGGRYEYPAKAAANFLLAG